MLQFNLAISSLNKTAVIDAVACMTIGTLRPLVRNLAQANSMPKVIIDINVDMLLYC